MRAIFLILTFVTLVGCIAEKGKTIVDIRKKKSLLSSKFENASITSVKIVNSQLIVTGVSLNETLEVKIDGNSLDEDFTIESKSDAQIIANPKNAFSFDISKVFSLTLSDSNTHKTVSVDFTLCQKKIGNRPINCNASVGANEVLSYDSSSQSWKTRTINSLNYQSTWDATTILPSGSSPGDYYIVNVAQGQYAAGDWIVWNGSSYDQIVNSNPITKVFGRVGDIVAIEGDYDLNKLADVDLPLASLATGKILKYDGSKWVADNDVSGGGSASIGTTELATGSITDAKIVTVASTKITGTFTSAQILDGAIVNADISASAAIDYSKLNIPNTTIPYVKLNIANGDIPAVKFLGIPAVTSLLATSIVDGDTTHAPDGNAVFDAFVSGFATKFNISGGGTINPGTISVPLAPSNTDDIVNKNYADTKAALKISKAGDTMTGDLTLNAHLKMLGGTNYVTLKAHASSTAYDFIFPVDKGTLDYILSTDGNGNTSWSSASDASVKTFAKTTLPNCSAGQVLKSDGTTLACVADGVGAGSFSGTINSAVRTDGAGALGVSATTATELSYVSGVTSSIQTQIDSKQTLIAPGTTGEFYRGDKAWLTLATNVVPENGNLYYLDSRARTAILTTTITNADTTHAPNGDVVYDTLVTKLSLTGGTLTSGTISGIPTPSASTDIVNKSYVDNRTALWTASGSDVYRSSGKVGIGGAPEYPFDIQATTYPVMRLKSTGASFSSASMILENGVNSSTGIGIYYLDPLSAHREWYWGKPNGADAMMLTRSATLSAHDQSIADPSNGVPVLTALANNYVGIGTTSPSAILDVRGTSGATLKIVDGNQGNGKILTSNASGVASWNAIPTCSAGQVLFADGTTLSCVTDSTTIFTGTGSKAVATDGAGALVESATTSTELGYVNGVTSAIQTQLNTKEGSIAAGATTDYLRGDKSWQTLSTENVPESGTKYYFTDARVLAGVLASTITNGDTTHTPNGDVVFDTFLTKMNLTGGTLTSGTIDGIPTPVGASDISNKAYVDSKVSTINSSGDTQILYNNAGDFGGSSQFKWDAAYKQVFITDYEIGPATGTNNFSFSNWDKMRNMTTGANNTGFNHQTGGALTTGSDNVALGVRAMRDQQTANRNVALGTHASISGEGNDKVIIGYNAHNSAAYTGSNLIVIGINLGTPTYTGLNQMNIGGWIQGINNGDIGIGKNNPAYKLDVTGDINATANVRAAGAYLSSDKRWKKNISPIENALSKIMQITGVTYDWARDAYPEKKFSDKKQIGVIAQDIEKVFPELVIKDKNGYLAVNYPALVGPTIEVFKTQQKQVKNNLLLFNTMKFGFEERIENHSRLIASLEKERDDLRVRNKILKNYLCSQDPRAPFCKSF